MSNLQVSSKHPFRSHLWRLISFTWGWPASTFLPHPRVSFFPWSYFVSKSYRIFWWTFLPSFIHDHQWAWHIFIDLAQTVVTHSSLSTLLYSLQRLESKNSSRHCRKVKGPSLEFGQGENLRHRQTSSPPKHCLRQEYSFLGELQITSINRLSIKPTYKSIIVSSWSNQIKKVKVTPISNHEIL